MQDITIGLFGDSFCGDKTKSAYKADTYIRKLEKHYRSKIVHLGTGGSSVWDLMLLQIDPFIKNNTIPDVCIFIWTEPLRVFNRTVRNINFSSVNNQKHKTAVWKAAESYYLQLADIELAEFQYVAALEYFDRNILSKFPASTKIIHLWSFGNPASWDDTGFDPLNISYAYTWTNGKEIRPALMSIALADTTLADMLVSDWPNHLKDEATNNKVFDIIKDAIDSYEYCRS